MVIFARSAKKSGCNNEETITEVAVSWGTTVFETQTRDICTPLLTGRLYLVRCGWVEVSNNKGIQLLA